MNIEKIIKVFVRGSLHLLFILTICNFGFYLVNLPSTIAFYAAAFIAIYCVVHLMWIVNSIFKEVCNDE